MPPPKLALRSRDFAGLIFDLDGTLTDTLPISFSAFRSAVAQFTERPFTDEELIAFFGPSEDGIFRKLLPDHWERCFEYYLKEFAALNAGRSTLFPGIEAALDLLTARQVRLAIVTGKARQATEITLGQAKIAQFFDAVEAGSAKGGVKPHSIRKVLERWNLSKSCVAYVGDAASDMHAAKAVGLPAIAAAWTSTANVVELNSAGADLTFTTVQDFLTWLRT